MAADSIVDRGTGPALVVVAGLQGRWDYVRPTVEALAASFRVITFSLGAECSLDGDARRILSLLDARGIDRAIVCGISYGGLVATRFGATHPRRTAALVLASTPGPRWRPRSRHRAYARLPWLLGPLFLAETPFRLCRELRAAFPARADRWRFVGLQLRTLVTAPLSLSQMARRAEQISTLDHATDCARIEAPTLIVTGEPELDKVVPVESTMEYVHAIRGARHAALERTGHLGTITRPSTFAAVVGKFARLSFSREVA